MSGAVRLVLWDADGVLQRVPDGGEESMRPAVEGLVEDVDGFLADARRRERPALTGKERWLDVLPGLLADWGIASHLERIVETWLAIEEVPGARAVVRDVRATGVRCFLASNQDEHRGRHMQRHLGYPSLVDGALYSYELGAAKPDPAFFTAALRRLRASAQDVLLVDDNPTNVASAAGLGIRAETWTSAEPTDVLRAHLQRHGVLP